MFQVVAENDGKKFIREVYSARVNERTAETEFLMWWMGSWSWVPAKLYRPASPLDLFTVDPD